MTQKPKPPPPHPLPAKLLGDALFFRLQELQDEITCEDGWKLDKGGQRAAREIITVMDTLIALGEGRPVTVKY